MKNLHQIAKTLQDQGRHGDTVLAHISPTDAEILRLLGGAGSINPVTGLPEYLTWKKALRVAAPVVAIVAPEILPIIGTAIAEAVGITALTAVEAAAVGAATMSATSTALMGGNAKDILKSAGVGAAVGATGSAVSEGLGGGVTGAIGGGAAGGGAGALITGGDVARGALTGAAAGGVGAGVTQALSPEPLGTGLRAGAGGETGITSGRMPSATGMGGGTGIYLPATYDMSGYGLTSTKEPSGTDAQTAKQAGTLASQLTRYFLSPQPTFAPTEAGPTTAALGGSAPATQTGVTPGSAALAQALRLGEPIDVATGKGSQRPVWNIASLRVKDETGS